MFVRENINKKLGPSDPAFGTPLLCSVKIYSEEYIYYRK